MRTVLVALLALALFAPAVASTPARIDPRLAADLVATDTEPRSVIVHFAPDTDRAAALRLAAVPRAVVFENLPHLAWAHAPPASLRLLASSPGVTYLEADAPQAWHLDTATSATRAAELYAESSVLVAPDGTPLDGRGVGVAVVDSGVDATHGDLPHGSKVAQNLKFAGAAVVTVGGSPPGLWQDVPDSDTSSGHGTHVAGIVGGLGTSSAARFRGAAPGATLYAFGAGEGITVAHALAAFDRILEMHDSVEPKIRIVTNSWGGPGDHDPDAGIAQAVDAMVDAGLVVVFSAGNDGGDSSSVQTNIWGNNPKPGVVMVANYDDLDEGTRDGAIAGSSSRGDASRPETWPDVAAPGTRITSALAKGVNVLVPVGFLNAEPTSAATLAEGYVIASGTSMAAPHVAGVAAILLQARPDLTPAEVEAVLKSTTHRFGDLGEGGDPAAGQGLVDAVFATATALEPGPITLLEGDEASPGASAAGGRPGGSTPGAVSKDDGAEPLTVDAAGDKDSPGAPVAAIALASAGAAFLLRRRR
ncbi:MAG TPA: S8 family serine peptidase [Candidatus Thermoplasmatota archaeon]|nr:S8 family serine peptidase [Candidatus Thermoplasmatota archaeon]